MLYIYIYKCLHKYACNSPKRRTTVRDTPNIFSASIIPKVSPTVSFGGAGISPDKKAPIFRTLFYDPTVNATRKFSNASRVRQRTIPRSRWLWPSRLRCLRNDSSVGDTHIHTHTHLSQASLAGWKEKDNKNLPKNWDRVRHYCVVRPIFASYYYSCLNEKASPRNPSRNSTRPRKIGPSTSPPTSAQTRPLFADLPIPGARHGSQT